MNNCQGPHPVGYVDLEWIDNEASSKIPILIRLYYPADVNGFNYEDHTLRGLWFPSAPYYASKAMEVEDYHLLKATGII